MALLFLDSTYDITMGILDDDLGWREFKRFSGKKASVVLQSEVFNLLQSQGIKPQDLKGIVTIAGPGFYTGLRLSEGFADVFQFFKIPFYSFYTYEIPAWCGVKEGVWMTKAYRGEYFFHHWDDKKSENVLVGAKDLPQYLERMKDSVFIHSTPALDQTSLDLLSRTVSTLELLEKDPKKIFGPVLKQKLKRESFYFRAPEDEFKVSP